MKKIISIMCILFTFPTLTSAHTTLSTSTPNEGEVITEELRLLTVEFAGEIENQGTLTLINEKEEEIEIDKISIEEKKITGSLRTPLENGSYTLTWTAASTDGHVITGDIPFSVDIAKAENDAVLQGETGQIAETEENSENDQLAPTEEKAEEVSELETEAVKDNGSLISTISIIGLVILLAVGIWILLRKKR